MKEKRKKKQKKILRPINAQPDHWGSHFGMDVEGGLANSSVGKPKESTLDNATPPLPLPILIFVFVFVFSLIIQCNLHLFFHVYYRYSWFFSFSLYD